LARPVTVTYRIFPAGEAFAEAAASYYANRMAAFAAGCAWVRVAFSGGSTPKQVFAMLADPSRPYRALVPWEKLEFFFVDERTVPPEDKDSNYGMAKQALLDHVPLEPSQIHRYQGELDPEQAAARYESAVRQAFRLEGAEMPRFQLVSLGMGDDGHTASLFPYTEALHELGRIAVANRVPQKDTWRLTLTWPVINNAEDVSFLIKGADKAEPLRRVLLGGYDPEALPSQLIRPASGSLTLLLDADAAALLPPPNAEGTGVLEVTH
jgi:6-phosphogluconolactonase